MQPVPKPIPVDDPARHCCAIGEIHADALQVYVHEAVLEQILDYSERDLTRELGGFLLGGYHRDSQPYVEVREFMAAVDVRSRSASLTFTHETWAAMQSRCGPAVSRGADWWAGITRIRKLRVFLSGLRSVHSPALLPGALADRHGGRPGGAGVRVFSVARSRGGGLRLHLRADRDQVTSQRDDAGTRRDSWFNRPGSRMPDETLVIDDDDRYSRLRLIGWWDQEKLARARVLVVGAGALGNEVLKNLALLGSRQDLSGRLRPHREIESDAFGPVSPARLRPSEGRSGGGGGARL